MNGLVVYGTRYGTAEEIAEEIFRILKDGNVDVKLFNANEIRDNDISTYDLIVVGSGIKMGKWTKESKNILKKNQNILSNKKSCVVCILWRRQHRKINGRMTGEIFR